MNKRFLTLPELKQQKILNAGFKVFSSHTYKKASMQLIADDAGISKSLLFHYFRNKQTLYEFLFQSAMEIIQGEKRIKIDRGQDFFELIENEVNQRVKLVETFPFQYKFIMRVYDENNLINNEEINRIILEDISRRKTEVLNLVDKSKFKFEEDLGILYDILLDLSNGFYVRVFDQGETKKEVVLEEFRLYLTSLKRNYYLEGC
ncbi:hypothetical protein J27TS8_43500 [Robertmurraya siralis]|jgi:AcrR family transcriptional regulator|uniref:HTH tetR-type domain-containing protein n=1 Tax=Robertmurraya siralis TaxID=77777 RepID=A0A920BWE3_9BACI|nr:MULTISPECIES: TetR/AcrR family transcriptional regulator [Robertmurraya]MDF1510104.1 TetR/AcrR family transcriptional regulator [Robertmurraya sp. DFI.2.37]PAE20108.1 hypothetical protein CHH80_13105 [Bacillus sp. 7504-2]GIN64357.1 hypothetical protein J27TS8_43500 [Robertmurraya siralis]